MPTPEHRAVDPAELPWSSTTTSGVDEKQLAASCFQDPSRTTLVRLGSSAEWQPTSATEGAEVFVLEGTWRTSRGALRAGGYARLAPGQVSSTSSPNGCVLFVKSGPFAASDRDEVHLQSSEEPWLPGHGNLRVKSLSPLESRGAALVFWPASERFVRHQHCGGEEILVLSGEFRDEHGRYPAGTWIQSAHLSVHHPFVMEETVIFVKTGHLQLESNSA